MKKIEMTFECWIKNSNTKTTYILESVETKVISEQEYQNTVSVDTQRFFRRLGGTERATKAYTQMGFVCIQLTSISPNKSKKLVRKFNFKDDENI